MRSIRPPTNQTPPPHRSPVLLEDLLEDLHWPRLLGAWRLALSPGRVLICFGLLVGVAILDRIYGAIARAAGHPYDGSPLGEVFGELGGELGRFIGNAPRMDLASRFAGSTNVYELFVHRPLTLMADHWPLVLFVVPVVVVAFAITAGAVCRSVAMQFSLGATLPWRSASRFGFGRALSLTAALAGPVLAIWLIAAITAGFGQVMFAWKVSSVLGGLGFGLFIAAGFALALLSVGYLLACPLIIPAFACEGTDTFDAVQRGYSYAFTRPGRLIAYYVLGGAVVAVGVSALVLLVFVAATFTQRLTGAPIDPLATAAEMDRAPKAARWLVNLWLAVPIGLAAAYVMSLVLTVCTMIYLIMRRIVDGQDLGELWVPETRAAAEPVGPSVVPPAPVVAEKADYT